jgi:hypothetical protein
MKKIFYLIGLLLFVLMTLKPFSCTIFLTTEWTVSGITIFNGTPAVGTTIKLVALYRGLWDGDLSNVVTVTDGGAFSLDIDASGKKPREEYTIDLYMWEDDNLNNVRDTGEYYYGLEAATGCPVFDDDCEFVWHDDLGAGCGPILTDEGWNVDNSWISEESVDTAQLTEARITNKSSF